MKLSEEQKFIIQDLIKVKKDKAILAGFAGTGKSVVVQHLSQLLKDWAVCAYTGKAADVLRKKGLEASTIHSLIYVPETDANGNIILDKNGSPIFVLNPDIGCQGVIIDEASMVSQDIYDDLCSFNIPLIFVGDHGQLEPIGQDINLMSKPDYVLEKIHRNAGEIAFFAEFIRKGFRPAAFESRAGEKVKFISKRSAEGYYTEVDQIICAYNKTRVEINQATREKLGYKGNWPNEGERVMCLKNDKRIGIFNGMQGVASWVGKKPNNKMIFKVDDFETELRFDPSQFNREKYDIGFGKDDPHPFDFCHAITAHKSQGSEYDRVLAIEQKCDLWDHKRWAYTVASRAKQSLIWAY